jgi:hypothetical protein
MLQNPVDSVSLVTLKTLVDFAVILLDLGLVENAVKSLSARIFVEPTPGIFYNPEQGRHRENQEGG